MADQETYGIAKAEGQQPILIPEKASILRYALAK
jgi:hypothetical protein